MPTEHHISIELIQEEIDAAFSDDTPPLRLWDSYCYLKGYVRGLRNAGAVSHEDYYRLRGYVSDVYQRKVKETNKGV
jgi:hypothetical protein